MRVIGLTGGIASGKSTAARTLVELGARIVDADQVARDVVAPGQPALAEIVRTFGEEMLLPDGTLDRKRLGAAHLRRRRQAARAQRHHPSAHRGSRRRRGSAALREAGVAVAVYEAALLVENGVHHGLDGLIVVVCDEATQLGAAHRARRAVGRGGAARASPRRRRWPTSSRPPPG